MHTPVNVQPSRRCFGEPCCGCTGSTEELAGQQWQHWEQDQAAVLVWCSLIGVLELARGLA